MGIVEQAKNFVAEKVAQMPVPEATVEDVDLKGFGLDGVTLLAKVSISNPYAVPIPVGEISYIVNSAGATIASGSVPDPGSLKANGETVLDVTVKVASTAVVSLLRDAVADWDIDYSLELKMIADFPVIGDVTIPVSYQGVLKLPTFADLFKGNSEPSADASAV
ncbi:hypothetical protein ABFS83_13G173000 [Erythranthe nasuta]